MIDQYAATEKGNPRTRRATKKAHATLFKKTKKNPIYLEHLCFVIKEAGWQLPKYIRTLHLNKNVLKRILF